MFKVGLDNGEKFDRRGDLGGDPSQEDLLWRQRIIQPEHGQVGVVARQVFGGQPKVFELDVTDCKATLEGLSRPIRVYAYRESIQYMLDMVWVPWLRDSNAGSLFGR